MNRISSNNRRLAKNTMYLYVRSILTFLVTLYTSRVVLAQLGVIDYGVYNVVASVSTFMTIISGTLSQAMCRFMSYEQSTSDSLRLKQLYSTCINIVIIASILCLVFLETIGIWFVNNKLVIPSERVLAANIAYQGAIVVFLVNFFITPFNAEIVAHENMQAFARIAIVDAFLRLGIALLLPIISGDKLIVYALLLVVQSLLLVLLYYLYCKQHYQECSYVRAFNKRYITELMSFSGWTFVGSLAYVCKESGINFLLNVFCGPAVNSARAVAAQVTNSTSILGTQFLQATVPQITKLYAEDRLSEMHSLIIRSCRYGFLLFFLVGFPVFCFTPQILGIWLVEVPSLSSGFIRILLFYVLIKVMSSPLVTGIGATGNIRIFQIIYSLFEILTLPAAYVSLKVGLSPLLSAVFIVLAEFLELLCKLYYSRVNYKLSITYYIKQVYYRVFPIMLISTLIYLFVNHLHITGLINIFVGFVLVALFNAIVLFLIGTDCEEKVLIIGHLKKRINKWINVSH